MELFHYILSSVSVGLQILMIFVTLLLGFSLIGHYPSKKIGQIATFSLCSVVTYLLYWILHTNIYCYIIILILLVPVFKKAFQNSYLFTITAILMSLMLFMLQILAGKFLYSIIIQYSLNLSNMKVGLIILAIYIYLEIVICYKKISIFPLNTEMYIMTEKDQNREFKYNLMSMIAAMSLMIIWATYVINNITYFRLKDKAYLFSITVIVFIFIIFFIKSLFSYILERIEEHIDRKGEAELLNFMQIIRSQRHDFNFHLQAIFGMLETKKYDECRDYIRTMVKDATSMNDVLPVFQPALGAMLNTFREVALQKGINIEFLIYYNLEYIPCTVYEINKVIGNLIQNAIDELENDPEIDPWIEVMILKRSGSNIIKVSNKTRKKINNYEDIFNTGYSTKKSHEGIGLTTVQRIVSKYDGAVYFELDGDVIHFIAQIPLKY